jgi:folate-binding protein YgfZ
VSQSETSSPQADYAAARSAAVVFDLSDRTQIELTGADRVKFLHNFCTNDIKALKPGQGAEAFITNVQGKIVGHVFVFVGESALWLDTVGGQSERLIAHLSRYQITEDVTFTDWSAAWAELLVVGPQAAEVVSKLVTGSPPTRHLDHAALPVVTDVSDKLVVRRFDAFGIPAFLLAAPCDRLPRLTASVVASGERSTAAEVFESLRIEAGLPHYGRDVTGDNFAQEANRTRQAISFKKGCYLGQEPIARIDSLGHVNQELRVLRIASPSPPPPDSEVFPLDNDAKPAGRVTSSAPDFATDAGSAALAMVRRGFLNLGTQLRVRVAGQFVAATVSPPTTS